MRGSNPMVSLTPPSGNFVSAESRAARCCVALVLVAIALLFAAPASRASEASAEATRRYLYAGTSAAGIPELQRRVAADAADREARFGLGMLQFVRAVERLGQGFY